MAENSPTAEENPLLTFVDNVVGKTRVLIEHDKVNALEFLTAAVREVVALVDRLAPALEEAEVGLWAAIGPEHGYGAGDVSLPELERVRTEVAALHDRLGELVAARRAKAS